MSGRVRRDSARFRKALGTLGARIAEHRRRRKWSQDRLAEASGLSVAEIGKIERAELSCTIDTLLLIAAALDVPASTLIQDLDDLVAPVKLFADLD